MSTGTPSLGVIFGDRDFFPDQLVADARADVATLFEQMGIAAVMLGIEETKVGGVETHTDAEEGH